jgi:serine/threonine protein kinase
MSDISHLASLDKKSGTSGEGWSKVSSNAKSFLLALLNMNPSQRLTTSEALSHPWLLMQDIEDVEMEFLCKLESQAGLAAFVQTRKFLIAVLKPLVSPGNVSDII